MKDSQLSWKQKLQSYCVGGRGNCIYACNDIEAEIARLKTLIA